MDDHMELTRPINATINNESLQNLFEDNDNEMPSVPVIDNNTQHLH